MAALPKSAHPGATKALAEIWNAEDRDHARRRGQGVRADYGAKFPKAVAKITDASTSCSRSTTTRPQHWIHLTHYEPDRVDLRHRPARGSEVTKGPGSRAAGIAMAFKLIEAAQGRWRAVNAPHLVALVRAGRPLREGQPRRTTRPKGGDQQVA